MRRLLTTCAAMVAASTLSAQTLISPDEFLDEAEGKTLTFHLFESGAFFGVEQFLSRSLSVWREEGQDCVYGRVTTEGRELCFLYDHQPDQKVCWLPFRHRGKLLVRLASFTDPEVQVVQNITNDPIPCPNAPTS